MPQIRILTKIIESLKNYYLEKQNPDSNVFIFFENKIQIDAKDYYENIFKQINNMKLKFLALLNVFLIISLLSRITKIDKEKYDAILEILIITTLLFCIPVFLMMMGFFKSIYIKKKYLLYTLFGICLFLISLIIFFQFKNENLDNLTNSLNLTKNKEDSYEISYKKYKKKTDLFFNVANNKTLKNVNLTAIDRKNLRIHKVLLQINDLEMSNKEIYNIQLFISKTEQNKKYLLLIFNIAIYLLYFFICFGEFKILIFTFLFNFIFSSILFLKELNLDIIYIFIIILVNSIIMLFISITLILYKKLLEVIEYNFLVINFLLENFYTNLTELGILYTILEYDNMFDKREEVNLLKTKSKNLSKECTYLFTFANKKNKKEDVNNLKYTKTHNLIHDQTRQNLLNEVSITPCLNYLEGRIIYGDHKNLKREISNNLNENKLFSDKLNIIKDQSYLNISEKRKTSNLDNLILKKFNNKTFNFNFSLSENKNLGPQDNLKKIPLTKPESSLNKIKNTSQHRIKRINKINSSLFAPKFMLSSFYNVSKELTFFNPLQDNFKNKNSILFSNEYSFEKSYLNLTDLIKFNYQKIRITLNEQNKYLKRSNREKNKSSESSLLHKDIKYNKDHNKPKKCYNHEINNYSHNFQTDRNKKIGI